MKRDWKVVRTGTGESDWHIERKKQYQLVQNEILGNWIIVIGNWEDQITNDDNADPFETGEEAIEYAERNL